MSLRYFFLFCAVVKYLSKYFGPFFALVTVTKLLCSGTGVYITGLYRCPVIIVVVITILLSGIK